MIATQTDRMLYRVTEAAALLGLGRSTIYELVQAGELRTVHIGRAVRISRAELERWVRDQERAGQAA